jgi:hypothetical protein
VASNINEFANISSSAGSGNEENFTITVPVFIGI